jgi:hypothetical protein
VAKLGIGWSLGGDSSNGRGTRWRCCVGRLAVATIDRPFFRLSASLFFFLWESDFFTVTQEIRADRPGVYILDHLF